MKKKSICILGLGYIGLPTAVMFANHGHRVHGVDVNEFVVESIRNKKLHIEENELPERLTDAIDSGRFTVSTEPEEADVFILAVPSPIQEDKTANVEYIRQAAHSIVPYVQKGNLVILESTVPPRTVMDVVVPEIAKTGYKIGEEIFVSHSPERVIPGKVFEELKTNDRIIGGVGEEAARQTSELYRSFVEGKLHETDATTAELVKVMENTYRDVNIALANELAKLAGRIGVDIWEAIKLANYHPRVNIHLPGPGVGGHCIAVDPWFLVSLDPDQAKLIHTARQINDGMPTYTANFTTTILDAKDIDEPKIAALGLAFKGNIDDMRESPSLDVIAQLKGLGKHVVAFDPHMKEDSHDDQVMTEEEAFRDADALVILTDHQAFIELDPNEVKRLVRTPVIIDTKNCIDRNRWEDAGFSVYVLGNSKNN